ncbi:CPBP family glutamic-type intramembrane protease [Neptunicella sp.]|uniref:CPBP family glutamic-type intramembrane protease n=1 Tax=Neptunicella sp. TaxID=2125986 RepID=UPI003F690ACE
MPVYVRYYFSSEPLFIVPFSDHYFFCKIRSILLNKRFSRWLEFLLLFCLIPAVLIANRTALISLVIPCLIVVGGYCGAVLWFDPKFKRKRLGRLSDVRKYRQYLHVSFTFWGLIVVFACWYGMPDLFLSLPIQQPYIWLTTLLLYPILSVIQQELIFRTFFFHRFKQLFPGKTLRVALSTLCFSMLHSLYGNWIAVTVSALGGLLFGLTYLNTKSTLIVVIQHSAWGLLLLTSGVGNYFNSDMLNTVQ